MPYLVKSCCEQCHAGDTFTIGIWSQNLGLYICDHCDRLVNIPSETGRCPGCHYAPDAAELLNYTGLIPCMGERQSYTDPRPVCPKCQNGRLRFQISDHLDMDCVLNGTPPEATLPSMEKGIFLQAVVAVCMEQGFDLTEMLAYFGLTLPDRSMIIPSTIAKPIYVDIRSHLMLTHFAGLLGELGPGNPHPFRGYQQAIRASKQVDTRQRETVWLGKMGDIYAQQLGRTEAAIGLYQRAVCAAKAVNNLSIACKQLMNLGEAYCTTAEYHQAIAAHEQALAMLDDELNPETVSAKISSLCNLAMAHQALGEIERPLELYEEALSLASKISDRQSEGEILGHLGNIYRGLGPLDKAVSLYRQAIQIAHDNEDYHREAFWLGHLGLAYSRQDDTVDLAKQCLYQALAIFVKLDSPDSELVQTWLAKLE